MDIRFLQGLSEGFVTDRELTGKVSSEEISSFLLESLRELRFEDSELYDELYQKPKFYQKEILECILEYEIYGISKIEESLAEGLKSIINNDEVLTESGEAVVLTEVIESIIDKIKDSNSGFKIIQLSKGLIKAFSAVSGAIVAVWIAPLFLAIPILLTTVGLVTLTKSGSRSLFEIIETIGSLMLMLAKWMKSAGTSMKYRYVMAFKNDETCYAKLGIDANSVRALVPWLFKSKTHLTGVAPAVSVDQAKKLRECFMNGMVTKISLFLEFYFDCIKKTGGWHEIMNAGEDKLMKIIAGGGMSPACDEYHKNAKEFIDTFEELLNTFYENDPEQASNWRKALYSDIMNTRKSVDRKQSETYRKWSDEGKGSSAELRTKSEYSQKKDYKRKY